MGIQKTIEKGKLCPYYWHGMQQSITHYVNSCEICGERKSPQKKKRHKLKSYIVGGRFERLATDIAGPFPVTEKNKNRYILVVGDYFTKLTEIYPMPDMQAVTVADIIIRGWIKRYGCPQQIHSDQGRQYESLLFQELCKLLEIDKTRTTPLHPRSDGMIERMNRTIQDMLSKYIQGHQKDWDQHLDFLTMAYNSTPHESTGFSPHKMVFGEEMRYPLDLISDSAFQENSNYECHSDFVSDLQQKLKSVYAFARAHLSSAAARQKRQYDLKAKQINYEKGQLVWRNQKRNLIGRKLKIARHWTGPWVIVEKLSDILFRIQCKQKNPSIVIHGDNLKPYKGNKKLNWFKNVQAQSGQPELPNLQEFPEHTDRRTAENMVKNELPSRSMSKIGWKIALRMTTVVYLSRLFYPPIQLQKIQFHQLHCRWRIVVVQRKLLTHLSGKQGQKTGAVKPSLQNQTSPGNATQL